MKQGDSAAPLSAANTKETIVVLPADLTIGGVGQWYAVLLETLGGRDSLRLDGTAVEAIDGAGIQLLAAFVRTVERHRRSWDWIGASDVLRDATRQLGLASSLSLGDG